MITYLVGKTPSLIGKSIGLLFLFDIDTLDNNNEEIKLLPLSVVITLVYLRFLISYAFSVL